ncbi:MAG: MmcQ/YjbR family DNA-binding protein [Draconibacterium sp.]
MNVEEIRDYCIAKKAVTESFPFNETTLVFKVMNKMFCLLGLDDLRLALKNDPEKNIELRAHFPAIIPGYHMNKQHWNTIQLDGTISPVILCELIDESYNLILNRLPKKYRKNTRIYKYVENIIPIYCLNPYKPCNFKSPGRKRNFHHCKGSKTHPGN